MSYATVARQAPGPPQRRPGPVRVAVIGLGRMGSDHVRRLMGDVGGAQVVAACDPDAAARERHEDEFGIATFINADAMLDESPIDGVIIASPGELHVAQLLSCLERGLPILCEKPLAPTISAGQQIIDAEVAHGRRLIQLGFMRRFDDELSHLVATVHSNEIGDPLLVHCVHRNPSVRPTYVSENSLNDSLTHEIDLLRWLLNDEVVGVQVMVPRSTPNAPHLADPKLILLEMASGVIADVEMYVNAAYGYEVRCEVVGSEGTVTTAVGSGPVLRHTGRVRQRIEASWAERFAQSYRREVASWIRGIDAGVTAGPSAWDGLVASHVAAAAVESYRSGRRVAVDALAAPTLYRS